MQTVRECAQVRLVVVAIAVCAIGVLPMLMWLWIGTLDDNTHQQPHATETLTWDVIVPKYIIPPKCGRRPSEWDYPGYVGGGPAVFDAQFPEAAAAMEREVGVVVACRARLMRFYKNGLMNIALNHVLPNLRADGVPTRSRMNFIEEVAFAVDRVHEFVDTAERLLANEPRPYIGATYIGHAERAWHILYMKCCVATNYLTCRTGAELSEMLAVFARADTSCLDVNNTFCR
jgi:hypothetical protein